jgi:hypothetical protein
MLFLMKHENIFRKANAPWLLIAAFLFLAALTLNGCIVDPGGDHGGDHAYDHGGDDHGGPPPGDHGDDHGGDQGQH